MLSYGYPAQPKKDPLPDLVNTTVCQFDQGTDSSAFLADVASALEYILAWFPGAGWKPTVDKAKKTLIDMTDVLLHLVQEQIPVQPWSLTNVTLLGKEVNLTGFPRHLGRINGPSPRSDTTISLLRISFLVTKLCTEVPSKKFRKSQGSQNHLPS